MKRARRRIRSPSFGRFSRFEVDRVVYEPLAPAVSASDYVPRYTSRTTLTHINPILQSPTYPSTGGSVGRAIAPALLAGAAAIGGGYLWMRYAHPKLARGLSRIGLIDKKVFTRRRKTKKGKVVVEQVRR